MINLTEDNINALSPYQVSVVGGNKVVFVTDFGVRYVIVFDMDDTSLSQITYQFVITNANNKRSPRDKKLRDTIIAIVEDFFAENNEVLLYICETGDGKQAMRSRLFNYWFSSFAERGKYTMLQSSIKDDEGVENFFAIISRNDNPALKDLIIEFGETISLLTQKPE